MSKLKTSDKITFIFTMFTFISLIILLIGVNIIYFFAWYSDQKAESMYDMDINYNIYNSWKSENNLEAFKEYILQKDTLILWLGDDEIVCSVWVESKIHKNLFFAGEVLNIDAVTGGFNFQNAWTGGFIAGKAIAE